MQCEDCRGTGIDPGALGPWDNAPCQGCGGTGVEPVAPLPEPLYELTLEERLAASIAVALVRRPNRQVAEPLRSILNRFVGGAA